MKNIFLTYTPFHILTACGLASEKGNAQENILIFFKDFPNSDIYYDAIKDWKHNPFKDIYIIDEGMQFAQKSLKQRFGFSRAKLNAISRFWEKNLKNTNESCYIYSFNDDTVESQFLFSKNTKERNYYVEDGFSSYYYNPGYKNLAYHLKKIIRKVFFGFWVERPYPYGTSKKVSRVYSYYPDFIVGQLREKEIVQLSPSIFDTIFNKGLIEILQKRFSIPDIRTSDSAGFILFPLKFRLDELHADIQAFINSLLVYFTSHAISVDDIYLKCHPRETSPVEQKIAPHFPKINVLEKTVSAEILFLIMRNKIQKHILIVGPLSTAFITARVILGEKVKIACVIDSLTTNPTISEFFNRMNIELGSYHIS